MDDDDDNWDDEMPLDLEQLSLIDPRSRPDTVPVMNATSPPEDERTHPSPNKTQKPRIQVAARQKRMAKVTQTSRRNSAAIAISPSEASTPTNTPAQPSPPGSPVLASELDQETSHAPLTSGLPQTTTAGQQGSEPTSDSPDEPVQGTSAEPGMSLCFAMHRSGHYSRTYL
jgi:hypothetical protein